MKNYHVISRNDGSWSVVKESATRASSIHTSQKDAVDAAHILAKTQNSDLKVHNVDGTIHSTFKYSLPSKPAQPTSSSLGNRVGERLQRARKMRGYSLRSLSEALDGLVSHSTLQKFEKGEKTPDLKILGALARCLDVRPDYFMKSDDLKLEKVEYRKLSKLGKKAQSQLEEEAFEFFERYLEAEAILGIEQPKLPSFDLTLTTAGELSSQAEQAAERMRKLWHLGENPLPNVHSMLEQHGVKVKIFPDLQSFDGFSAFAHSGEMAVPTVALSQSSTHDLPRMRFTALHELGHLLFVFASNVEQKDQEKLCHRFAGAMLVPKNVFIKVFGKSRTRVSTPELKAIKAEWGISFGAIMKRAHDLKLITDGAYKSFFIVTGKWGWRKEEPGHWAGTEKSSRFKQLVFRGLAEERMTISKACGLLHYTNDELAKEYQVVS